MTYSKLKLFFLLLFLPLILSISGCSKNLSGLKSNVSTSKKAKSPFDGKWRGELRFRVALNSDRRFRLKCVKLTPPKYKSTSGKSLKIFFWVTNNKTVGVITIAGRQLEIEETLSPLGHLSLDKYNLFFTEKIDGERHYFYLEIRGEINLNKEGKKSLGIIRVSEFGNPNSCGGTWQLSRMVR